MAIADRILHHNDTLTHYPKKRARQSLIYQILTKPAERHLANFHKHIMLRDSEIVDNAAIDTAISELTNLIAELSTYVNVEFKIDTVLNKQPPLKSLQFRAFTGAAYQSLIAFLLYDEAHAKLNVTYTFGFINETTRKQLYNRANSAFKVLFFGVKK